MLIVVKIDNNPTTMKLIANVICVIFMSCNLYAQEVNNTSIVLQTKTGIVYRDYEVLSSNDESITILHENGRSATRILYSELDEETRKKLNVTVPPVKQIRHENENTANQTASNIQTNRSTSTVRPSQRTDFQGFTERDLQSKRPGIDHLPIGAGMW